MLVGPRMRVLPLCAGAGRCEAALEAAAHRRLLAPAAGVSSLHPLCCYLPFFPPFLREGRDLFRPGHTKPNHASLLQCVPCFLSLFLSSRLTTTSSSSRTARTAWSRSSTAGSEWAACLARAAPQSLHTAAPCLLACLHCGLCRCCPPAPCRALPRPACTKQFCWVLYCGLPWRLRHAASLSSCLPARCAEEHWRAFILGAACCCRSHGYGVIIPVDQA